MNWNVNYKPGLIAQHHSPTNLACGWGSVSARFQNLVENLPRRGVAVLPAILVVHLSFGMRCSLHYRNYTQPVFQSSKFYISPNANNEYEHPLSPTTSPPLSVLWLSAFLPWCYLLSWQRTPGLIYANTSPQWLHMLGSFLCSLPKHVSHFLLHLQHTLGSFHHT